MDRKILIIGATGLLGEPVAIHLRRKGYIVRLMVRDVEKATDQFGDDFEIVQGNINDTERLEKALDGCFGVHINLSGEIEKPGVETVSSKASELKLQRITYISGTSVAEENTWFPLIKNKFLAEKIIRSSGVPFTIFCPTWFMENLPKFVRGNRAFVFGKQPNTYHFIAADDYARMVAVSYGLEAAINKRFIIHGPEDILYHDAVERYCKYFYPQIKKVSTMPYWLASVIASIRGSEEMKFASSFMAAFEKIGEKGDPSEANMLLGAPTIRLDEWFKLKRDQIT